MRLVKRRKKCLFKKSRQLGLSSCPRFNEQYQLFTRPVYKTMLEPCYSGLFLWVDSSLSRTVQEYCTKKLLFQFSTQVARALFRFTFLLEGYSASAIDRFGACIYSTLFQLITRLVDFCAPFIQSALPKIRRLLYCASARTINRSIVTVKSETERITRANTNHSSPIFFLCDFISQSAASPAHLLSPCCRTLRARRKKRRISATWSSHFNGSIKRNQSLHRWFHGKQTSGIKACFLWSTATVEGRLVQTIHFTLSDKKIIKITKSNQWALLRTSIWITCNDLKKWNQFLVRAVDTLERRCSSTCNATIRRTQRSLVAILNMKKKRVRSNEDGPAGNTKSGRNRSIATAVFIQRLSESSQADRRRLKVRFNQEARLYLLVSLHLSIGHRATAASAPRI